MDLNQGVNNMLSTDETIERRQVKHAKRVASLQKQLEKANLEYWHRGKELTKLFAIFKAHEDTLPPAYIARVNRIRKHFNDRCTVESKKIKARKAEHANRHK